MIYPISYLLDQFLNMVFGFGAIGLCLVLIVALASRANSQKFLSANLKILPPIRYFWIAVLITAWSLMAAFNAPSCGITLKGLFSLFLAWAIFLIWPTLQFSRIVYSPKASSFILTISSIALVMQILNWGPLSQFWYFNKPSGLYTEPSHLAMYIFPIIGFRLLNNYKDYLSIGVVIFIAAFFNSATFLIGIILLVMIIGLKKFLRSRNKPLFLMCSLGCGLGVLFLIPLGLINPSILTDRIEGILLAIYRADAAGITNASAIVWLNGWSQAYDTLLVTRGLGLGINQMGCGDFIGIGRFSDHISLWTGGVVLNWNDGSFLISKLTAELGMIGICIISFLIIKSCHAIYRYLIYSEDKPASGLALHAIGGICVLMLLFIRSNGYFLEPVILDLSLLFACDHIKKSST